MSEAPRYVFFIFAASLAFFIKGIAGFGNTLVMSPLFSFEASNRLITPVDLFLSLPTNAMMAFRERRQLSLKIVLPLSLLLLAGIIPGVFLLKIGNDWLLKAILGAVVISLGAEMLLRKPAEAGKKTHPAVLAVIGVASGVLCGLFGIGALLVAYIGRTTDSSSAFRGNLCCVFLVENLFRLAIYLAMGIMTGEALLLGLLLLPFAAASMAAGMRLNRRMNEQMTKRAVSALLFASGTVLFITNVIFH
jgi:uncharacterized protein